VPAALLIMLFAACGERPAQPAAQVSAASDSPAVPALAASTPRDTSVLDHLIGLGSTAQNHRNCLTIANDSLQVGTRLAVVSPRLPQSVDTAVIVAKRERACSEPGDERGTAHLANASYYNIEFSDSVEFIGPTIVLAGKINPFTVQDSTVIVDLDGDGHQERFHECTSSEGGHYFVFTGPTRRWHAYYYVPYDVEPNCSDALFSTTN
jgi:hypothetical protein